jgi:UDP-N-acetylmuramoylalanine--D-glutamate ligase
MDIVQYLNGKKILIWGYGREGKSTENFLATYCTPASVAVYEGDRVGIDEAKYDLICRG